MRRWSGPPFPQMNFRKLQDSPEFVCTECRKKDRSSFPEFSQVVHIISANPDHFVYSGKQENFHTPRAVSHLLVSKEDSRLQPGPASSDLFVLVAVQI